MAARGLLAADSGAVFARHVRERDRLFLVETADMRLGEPCGEHGEVGVLQRTERDPVNGIFGFSCCLNKFAALPRC